MFAVTTGAYTIYGGLTSAAWTDFLQVCLLLTAGILIPGMRNAAQAEANCGVSDLPKMPDALVTKLRRHNWRRGVWYGGK